MVNQQSKKLFYCSNIQDVKNCNIFIITTPTPVKKNNVPDLSLVMRAVNEISKVIKRKDLIILESTVYPGVTENRIGKFIIRKKKWILNKDFYLGYSPERINPGDVNRSLTKITKIISASNSSSLNIMKHVYGKILNKNFYVADSIKVAESAKVIENIQRDLNIALINELSKIFNKLNIDTESVLKAAETKWNFAKYRPGMVGGHCIGVDPYYLTFLAEKLFYKPKLILAGREINKDMPTYIYERILQIIKKKKLKIALCGASFKENCTDLRNSGTAILYKKLIKNFFLVHVYDPVVNFESAYQIYGNNFKSNLSKNYYDLIVIIVNHDFFKKKTKTFLNSIKTTGKIFDLKYIFKNNIPEVVRL
jgi:UDP-N-acetyl-D-galactosamine dehydrogenase